MGKDGKLDFGDREDVSLRLCAMGDISFGGAVQEVRSREGADSIFAAVREDLKSADLRIGNLESVLVEGRQAASDDRGCLLASPATVACLLDINLDVATFANNHIMDAGPDGLVECLEHLSRAGLQTTGAGRNLAEACKPVILTCRGVTLCFWAYSYGMGQIAGKSRPGCAEASMMDILRDIRSVPGTGRVNVVSLHMDAEFQETPAPERVKFCRLLAEQGVDVVLCHHPHVPQGIERWGDSLIAYSLGNYVFGEMPYLTDGSDVWHKSFHLFVDFDNKGVRAAEIVPVLLDADGRPRIAIGDEKESILELVARRSALLADRDALSARYQAMVSHWGKSFFQNLYWACGERDWNRVKLFLTTLKSTKTKRRWMRDFLLSPLFRMGLLRF